PSGPPPRDSPTIRAETRHHRRRHSGGAVLSGPLDDDHPQRVLVLGFDTHSRVLELIALHYDDGTIEVIHAMKARRSYLNLLE
ncbi:MAG: toxin, partial [Dietzia psychralcaliphila]